MTLFLDSNATSPLGKAAQSAMLPWLSGAFGNPHVLNYAQGREAAQAVEDARSDVMAMLGDTDHHGQFVFTSGATEANNLALRSVVSAHPSRREILCSAIEHASVMQTVHSLTKAGYVVKMVDVDPTGRINLQHFDEMLNERTALVSIIHGNNEIGTIQDLSAISARCRAKGVCFHTDATQSAWIEPPLVNHDYVGPDMISLSAHKMYGPQGIGALWWKDSGIDVSPQITGGGQQGGFRAGTVPVMLAVGFGAAARYAMLNRQSSHAMLMQRRNQFLTLVRRAKAEIVLLGHPDFRLPHNLSLLFPHVPCSRLLPAVTHHLAVSSTAACQGQIGFSHVLSAIGLKSDNKSCVLRFGFSLNISEDDLVWAAEKLIDIYSRFKTNTDLLKSSHMR